MKKICITGCLCLALLLLLPGCAGKRTLTSVRLSEVTHSVFYAPQYVAMSQGFFREEGLDVELTNGGGADKVMTAVVSGQADMSLAGPEAAIYVMNQGKEDHPVILAQLTKRDGSFLVGRTPGPFSWDQVRGKTIIGGRAGGVPEMTLEYVLRQNGVEPQRDAVVDTSVQFNMMAGAFTGGNGDYVTLFEPTATEVEQAGKGYILCSIGRRAARSRTPRISLPAAMWTPTRRRSRALSMPLPGPSSGWRSTRTGRWPRPSAISSRTRTWIFWSVCAPGTGRSMPGTAPR